MKPKQEHIDEIAKTMCEEFGTDVCNYDCPCINTCANKDISERLYSAGYRKASDVIDEFVQKLGLKFAFYETISYNADCEEVYHDLFEEIDEIADEMRKEVK